MDLRNSHVIPALIRKCVEAKQAGAPAVEVWGTGTPTREFLYVEDAARGIMLASERYDKPDPVNLGSSEEISIRDLVTLIAELTDFEGEIVFDATKPDGQPRRKLNVERAKREFGFMSETPFRVGTQADDRLDQGGDHNALGRLIRRVQTCGRAGTFAERALNP
jgi:GDP-L-fucose synthase